MAPRAERLTGQVNDNVGTVRRQSARRWNRRPAPGDQGSGGVVSLHQKTDPHRRFLIPATTGRRDQPRDRLVRGRGNRQVRLVARRYESDIGHDLTR